MHQCVVACFDDGDDKSPESTYERGCVYHSLVGGTGPMLLAYSEVSQPPSCMVFAAEMLSATKM